jgi:hypothetical protein
VLHCSAQDRDKKKREKKTIFFDFFFFLSFLLLPGWMCVRCCDVSLHEVVVDDAVRRLPHALHQAVSKERKKAKKSSSEKKCFFFSLTFLFPSRAAACPGTVGGPLKYPPLTGPGRWEVEFSRGWPVLSGETLSCFRARTAGDALIDFDLMTTTTTQYTSTAVDYVGGKLDVFSEVQGPMFAVGWFLAPSRPHGLDETGL